jgi:hypothetical protein
MMMDGCVLQSLGRRQIYFGQGGLDEGEYSQPYRF